MTKAYFMSDRQDWGTPQAFFDWIENIFSINFTLDACASSYNYKVANYFDVETNALIQDWGGQNVWLNPPYTRKLQTPFISKAIEESEKGATVFCLIPSRTDTKLFHDLIFPNASGIYFVRGRLNFENVCREGPKNGTATFPSMLVIFGDTFRTRVGSPYVDTLEPTLKQRGF